MGRVTHEDSEAATTVRWAATTALLAGLASLAPARFAALIGVVVLALCVALARGSVPVAPSGGVIGLGILLSLLYAAARTLFPARQPWSPELVAWLVPLVAVAAMASVGRLRSIRAMRLAMVVLVTAVVAPALMLLARDGGSSVGIDVYLAHQSAADALMSGENPYSEVVQFPNGSPTAPEGSRFAGYGYPPVSLWAYGAAGWLFGEPRWISLLAWSCVVALVMPWRTGIERSSRLWLAVSVAAAPAWLMVLYAGWTEPITALLVFVSGLAWRRNLILSAIALGLAFGSKQYMLLVVPVYWLLSTTPRDRLRWRVAVAVAAATLVPYAIWDWGLLVDRLVIRPASFGWRPDSGSLLVLLDGLGWRLESPLVGALIVALLLAWFVTRRPAGRSTAVFGSAAVLAGFFLFSSAFANYWFLIAALTAVGGALVIGGESAHSAGRGLLSADHEDGGGVVPQ